MKVAFSESGPTLYLVQGRAKPVLQGPSGTESNLLHQGMNVRESFSRALEQGTLVIAVSAVHFPLRSFSLRNSAFGG